MPPSSSAGLLPRLGLIAIMGTGHSRRQRRRRCRVDGTTHGTVAAGMTLSTLIALLIMQLHGAPGVVGWLLVPRAGTSSSHRGPHPSRGSDRNVGPPRRPRASWAAHDWATRAVASSAAATTTTTAAADYAVENRPPPLPAPPAATTTDADTDKAASDRHHGGSDKKKDELLQLLLLVSRRRRRRSSRGGGTPKVEGGSADDNDKEGKPQQQPPPRETPHRYWERVASCINELEGRYECPPQTVDFFHFATSGTWIQVLCTQRQRQSPSPQSSPPQSSSTLSVKRVQQEVVDAKGRNSTVRNVVNWELLEREEDEDEEEEEEEVENEKGTTPVRSSSSSGTFSIVCGARMSPTGSSRQHWTVLDRTLELDRGSMVPRNVPHLVQLLSRNIPSTLLDPDGTATDTTYLDADVRIVRHTGDPRREGVRDVFVRPSVIDQYDNPVELVEFEGDGSDSDEQ